jgi:hypothetical protein
MLEQAATEPEPATAEKYSRRASINSSVNPSPSKQTANKEDTSPRNSRSSPRGSISPRRTNKDQLLRSPYSVHHPPDESITAHAHSPHHVHYKGEKAEEKRGSSSSPSRKKQNSNKAKISRTFDRKSRLMRFAEESKE